MEVVRLVGRSPLRTVRTRDLAAVYQRPRVAARALERRGVLHRLAHGYYCAVPAEHDPVAWRPSIEAAGAGIATAIYGGRVPVLMGMSAARLHHAFPRAIGSAHVAVPRPHRMVPLLDREGSVEFSARDVQRLDAVLMTTDLGQALVTGVEQTILDLARSDPRGEDPAHGEAIYALWPRRDDDVLERLAADQRMRATLERVRSHR